jgi:hypothetical protein
MKTVVKIVLTLIAFIFATFLMGIMKTGTNSDSTGVFGLVIGAGLIAGIVAIWKYKPKNTESIDNHKLDKN